MRIALVCPYDLGRFGGVQDQVLALSRWLQAAGHDAWVVAPGPEREGVVSLGGSVVINANGSSTPISLTPRVVGRVVDAVRDADVVHIHEPLMPLVSLAATLRVRTPSVGTFHADANRWVRSGYRKLFGVAGGRVGRLDVVTAVSPVAAGALAHSVVHHIVPNGLDLADYQAGTKLGGRVAFLGRDDPRKALDAFVIAARTVSAAHPDSSFVVAGTEVEARRGVVEFVGRPDDESKRRLLAQSEVFVAPHRGGESFGMVVAEAMAAGCAVVASALPAFAHVLGDAGILVPPGDPGAIAEAVGRLLADDDLRSGLQGAARARVKRFDRSVVVGAYLRAYEEALAG